MKVVVKAVPDFTQSIPKEELPDFPRDFQVTSLERMRSLEHSDLICLRQGEGV